MKTKDIIPLIGIISFFVAIITLLVGIWTVTLVWFKISFTAVVVFAVSNLVYDDDDLFEL